MKLPLPERVNTASFRFACKKMNGLNFLPAYGTLLGLTRQGRLIDGDDDADFFVFRDDYQRIRDRFIESDFKICFESEGNFMQLRRFDGGHTAIIDFFFIEKRSEVYVDKWNFIGEVDNPAKHLFIPAEYIEDICLKTFCGVDLQFPRNADQFCELLYGADWKIPRLKGYEYETEIVGNKPRHVPTPSEKLGSYKTECQVFVEQIQQRKIEISQELEVLNFYEEKFSF